VHIIEAIINSTAKRIAISVFSNQREASKQSYVASIRHSFDGTDKELFFYESNSHPLGKLNQP
jgi:hypothetical protein